MNTSLVEPITVPEKIEEYHAGQTWLSAKKYVDDFTVTINGLGTPKKALEAAKNSLELIVHYPAHDQEPAVSDLSAFMCPADPQYIRSRVVMGNGASELIDLVTRLAPAGPFRPGPTVTQYKEYERSARACKREILSAHDSTEAALTAIINPCNPTGDFMDIPEVKNYILTKVANGSFFIVDESNLPFYGPDWRAHSMMMQREFIAEQARERNVYIYVMHSWTKIWCCPGLRLGSIVCPSEEHQIRMRSIQVPWSLSTAAIAFTSEVVKDKQYLEETWEVTPKWRTYMAQRLQKEHPDWKLYGVNWLSWIWIDCGSVEAAEKAIQACYDEGCPVREGKKGYLMPSFIRVAVRPKHISDVLLDVLKKL